MGRIRRSITDGTVEHRISPPRYTFLTVFLILWWLIAVGGAVDIVEKTRQGAGPQDAVAGAGMMIVAAYITVRWLFGQEIIRVTGNILTVRFDTFGLGWTRKYVLSDIHLIRVEQPWEHRFALGAWFGNEKRFGEHWHTLPGEYWPPGHMRWIAPVITFEYRGREHRFGLDLDRQTANDLVAQLQEDINRARASLHSGSGR